MLSWKRVSLYVALSIVCSGSCLQAQSLRIGDPAPKLEVKFFAKGEPVKAIEPGKNYVVEFWATWCGPCLTSIPHLTELQKKFPDITFIGVSIEAKSDLVKPFVEKRGDEMNYRVAVDNVPKGKSDGDGAMGVAWMAAAEQDGIPTAFVVNKEGKIAWIGHPMEMDKPLEMVANGKWNIKVAAEEQRREREQRNPGQKLLRIIEEASRAGNAKELLSALDEVLDPKADVDAKAALPLFATLIKLGLNDKALEYGKKLEKSGYGKDVENLNLIAWTIVDPDSKAKPSAKLIEFAVEMARRADERSEGKSGSIIDTLAKAYFDSGDAAKAVEAQERAIRVTRENGESVDQDMKDRLEKYKKAAKK
jgi:thiol-disulfide isomerase/thioredoxin